MNWEKLYNPFVIWLLRSPLHGLIDKSTVLITFRGRKSGKIYSFPVSYARDGDTLDDNQPEGTCLVEKFSWRYPG